MSFLIKKNKFESSHFEYITHTSFESNTQFNCNCLNIHSNIFKSKYNSLNIYLKLIFTLMRYKIHLEMSINFQI